jgi:diaminobutyrate-2-oxoglutarate transaminase
MTIQELGFPSFATLEVDSRDLVQIFEERESAVRSYCRSFPAVFTSAKGAHVTDARGHSYIDFLAGAGALNYGHNHDTLKRALLEYISDDGITHGLDLYTVAKENFLRELTTRILQPRSLDYKVQFTGPTGANAVEAALKIARKATGRSGVFAFMGGYHGHSLGSLAVTSNRTHRGSAGTELGSSTFLPFPGGSATPIDTLAYMRTVLEDSHSGVGLPAAVIVETVQAEGGVNVAPIAWLRELRAICDHHGILLIVDEIQTGCGRTGPFFSFERAGIVPDIVTLSKSISGYGLPMALTLMRPELDLWMPGEHTGTFRGNQLAFVTGAAALALFDDPDFQQHVTDNSATIADELVDRVALLDDRIKIRGLGMIWGVDTAAVDPSGGVANVVAQRCFAEGLIIERTGRNDTVLKILPPLNIENDVLCLGLAILAGAIESGLGG